MKWQIFDKNYAEYYDFFNDSKDYSSEVNFIWNVIKKYSSEGVNSVLDLGCGTGEHSRHLSKRKIMITGIDISPEMIEIAKSKKIMNSKFFVGDISNFSINEKFDMAICMFAAIGYVVENKALRSAIRSIKEHLKPGSLFVFDCWNGLAVMNELPTSRKKEFDKNGVHVKRVSYPSLDSVNHICEIKFKVKMAKNSEKKEYEERHLVRFFFPQELRKYLEDEGFEILEFCRAFELGTKINEKDWNMVIISRLK